MKFVYCIANFDWGLRDISIFFSLSINPAGVGPGRIVTDEEESQSRFYPIVIFQFRSLLGLTYLDKYAKMNKS